MGEHSSAVGVPDRFPDSGLSRPTLLSCTKMSVSGATQVARKFLYSTFTDVQVITVGIIIIIAVACHVPSGLTAIHNVLRRCPLGKGSVRSSIKLFLYDLKTGQWT